MVNQDVQEIMETQALKGEEAIQASRDQGAAQEILVFRAVQGRQDLRE